MSQNHNHFFLCEFSPDFHGAAGRPGPGDQTVVSFLNCHSLHALPVRSDLRVFLAEYDVPGVGFDSSRGDGDDAWPRPLHRHRLSHQQTGFSV